ncbi:unnamed protein product [Diplocarpon coronariae]
MNRDLETHILANPATVLEQSFRLCSQAAEAVEYSDKNRVIYCDFELRNPLLDRDLNLKVFQNWAVIGTRSWTQEYGSAYKVVNDIAAV